MEIRLKEIARERGLSLSKLAIRSGVPLRLITMYANAHALPRVDRALQISSALGVCPSEIWILPKAA